MPQLDLNVTQGVEFNIADALEAVEKTIADFDQKAGVCKCRGHRIEFYRNEHVYLQVGLLKKPHRGAAFMDGMRAAIDTVVREHTPNGIEVGVAVYFSPPAYQSAM